MAKDKRSRKQLRKELEFMEQMSDRGHKSADYYADRYYEALAVIAILVKGFQIDPHD